MQESVGRLVRACRGGRGGREGGKRRRRSGGSECVWRLAGWVVKERSDEETLTRPGTESQDDDIPTRSHALSLSASFSLSRSFAGSSLPFQRRDPTVWRLSASWVEGTEGPTLGGHQGPGLSRVRGSHTERVPVDNDEGCGGILGVVLVAMSNFSLKRIVRMASASADDALPALVTGQ